MARWHVDVSLYLHADDIPAPGRAGLADAAGLAARRRHYHRYANYLMLGDTVNLILFMTGTLNVEQTFFTQIRLYATHFSIKEKFINLPLQATRYCVLLEHRLNRF